MTNPRLITLLVLYWLSNISFAAQHGIQSKTAFASTRSIISKRIYGQPLKIRENEVSRPPSVENNVANHLVNSLIQKSPLVTLKKSIRNINRERGLYFSGQSFFRSSLLKAVAIAFAVILSPGGIASAATTVSSSSPGIWRPRRVIKIALFCLITTILVRDRIAVRRRQRVDATSEWERYSKHPGARGRALMSLVFLQVAPLWIFSRLFRAEKVMKKAGRVLTQGLLQIGPLYCKMGQILSCRDESLPKSWIKELGRLQDEIPAQTGEKALQLAHTAWSRGQVDDKAIASFDETFREFETEPLAAASLGQVHKAVLRATNETVAVKVQRPFLRTIYDQDLTFLTNIAKAVDRFGGKAGKVGGVEQSWEQIMLDAEAILYREIDYRDEAENGIRFCRDFGIDRGGKPAKKLAAKARDGEDIPSAAPWLRAPYVFGDLCSEQVLVMEFVPSIKITDSAKLDAANVTAREREYLADCLGRAYLRQFCCHLFFSTDPHPGNLGCEVLSPGEMKASSSQQRVRLVFYDFGQAATLTQDQADGILDIIEAIVDLDVDKSIEAFSTMGVLKEDADINKVRAKVADNFKTGKVKANRKRLTERGYEFKDNKNKQFTEKMEEKTQKDTKQPRDAEVMKFFTLPAEYAFVGRALTQMAGVGKTLDGQFDFISAAAPWIYEIKGAKKYLKDEVTKRLDKWGLTDILPSYVDKKSSSKGKKPTASATR